MSHPGFEQLVAWWLGEAADIEEHYFACAQCTARLEWLAALSDGVRAALRAGTVGMVISAPFLARMKAQGMRVREYRLAPGSTVDCTIRADDDAVVGRIRALLGGVTRVDALERVEIAGTTQREMRLEDVPFDAASGEVLFMPKPAALKKMPANRMHLRLVAVEVTGERTLGEYTFAHTPS